MMDQKRIKAELESHIVSSELMRATIKHVLRSEDLDFLYKVQDTLQHIQKNAEEAAQSLLPTKRELLVKERLLHFGAISAPEKDECYHFVDSRGRLLCNKGGLWVGYFTPGYLEGPLRVGGLDVLDSLCPQCKNSEKILKEGRPVWWSKETRRTLLSSMWCRTIGYALDDEDTIHPKHPRQALTLCPVRPGNGFQSHPYYGKSGRFICSNCQDLMTFEDLLGAPTRRTQ